MRYLLDTNTCIRHLNQRSISIVRKMSSIPPSEIAVCSIVKAELFAGSAKSIRPQQNLAKQQNFLSRFVSLPFDDSAAITYGSIRASLEKQGTPIGPLDMMIAAIALTNNLTLVTHNMAEFSRVTNLQF
jgi:tRNA(fMet)-specific endonuclease VapC